jgi:3-hydroxyacyl-CoA dehydrogenase
MYECPIRCYTKAEYGHVLLLSTYPAHPQAEEATMEGPESTRIGVVGAGTMGAGIAEVFAEAGYEVVWYNRSEAGMQRGMARLRANQATLIRHGVCTQEVADMAWTRLHPTHTLQDLASVDLVSESITEHLEAKQALLHPPHTSEVAKILQDCVAAGKLGAKSGTGFYTYAAGRAEQLVAERDTLLLRLLYMKQASALDERDSNGREDTPGA